MPTSKRMNKTFDFVSEQKERNGWEESSLFLNRFYFRIFIFEELKKDAQKYQIEINDQKKRIRRNRIYLTKRNGLYVILGV
mmetsp:Transcript_63865/g.73245  ORF Transcript_63865/g.73245 Transcript_63865/m.73245 type:complete len:81 (+) Transcript_63865:755-997(+)